MDLISYYRQSDPWTIYGSMFAWLVLSNRRATETSRRWVGYVMVSPEQIELESCSLLLYDSESLGIESVRASASYET